MPNPGDLVPYGDDAIPRRMDDFGRKLREASAARSLEASSIGSGGLVVKDGGSITIEGTGSLNVGSGALNSAGSIAAATTITAGTDMVAGGIVRGATLRSTGNAQVDGSETVNGNSTIGGTVSASGLASFPAGVTSLDARNRVLSTGYAGAWIDSSGRFGIQPSSRRFKKNITPWSTDIAKLLELRRVTFRYIVAIDDDPDAMSKPKQLGFIAEEVVALGFPEFVFYDEDGEVQGLNYDRMVVALLELAVWEHDQNAARFAALEARLAAAGL